MDKSDGNIAAAIDEQTLSVTSCALQPLLLNQGEWFDVQLISDGPVEEPAINARIAGVTGKLADMEERRRKFQNRMLMAIVAGIVLVAFAINTLVDVPDLWVSELTFGVAGVATYLIIQMQRPRRS